jgi:adenylosuccinate synthase
MSHLLTSSAIKGRTGVVTGVLGAQWGDEGKSKLVDFIAGAYPLVARFSGGANVGPASVGRKKDFLHEVPSGMRKKYFLHQVPSGMVHPNVNNLIGHGTVLDVEELFQELEQFDYATDLSRLRVSDRVHVVLPTARLLDKARAWREIDIGSTQKDFSPTYCSKVLREGVRLHEARSADFHKRLMEVMSNHAAILRTLPGGPELSTQDLLRMLEPIMRLTFRLYEDNLVVDGVQYVNDYLHRGRDVLAEGAHGAMLDTDCGTYPFVTSSCTTTGGIISGLGVYVGFVMVLV